MELVEELRSEPREVARARRALTDALTRWGVRGDRYDVAVLLTSELVTNAIRYGREPVRLRARSDGRGLHVEVDDATPSQLPAAVPAAPDATGGRGLHLVDSLADRWGSRTTRQGKHVWFELDLTA